MSFHFKNQNFIIIGGTSGIGYSIVRSLLQNKAKVVAVGLSQPEEKLNENCKFIIGDVTDQSVIDKAIKTNSELFGELHGLVHVAGGSGRKWGDGPIHQLTNEAWLNTMDLNLTTVMYSNRAAINQFLNQKSKGSIVNISSVLAEYPSPQHFNTHAYAAAKSAIIGLSKSMASYYAAHDIRVNVVAPALTNTTMASRASQNEDIQYFIKSKQPLDGGRMAEPSDIDQAVCYFLSEGARFTTGQVLSVDGGWSISDGQVKS